MKGASGQHLVDQLQNKIEEVHSKHRDKALEIWWTPGHEGIKENERADEEAKRVARGNSSPDDQLPCTHRGKIKTSRSAVRQSYSKKLKNEAAKQFASSPRYLQLQEINPSTLSSKFRKDTEHLLCEQTTILIQLRMGHIPLSKYLHRIGKTNSPMCHTCSHQRETVHYYLMTCPAYMEQRRQLEQQVGRAAKSLKMLLTNLKIFPHLFQYISATHHFNPERNNPNLPGHQE